MHPRVFILSALLCGLVWAQPLAELAPDGAVLTLGWSFEGKVLESLEQDLAALPWQAGRESAAKLLRALSRTDPDMGELWSSYAEMLESGERLVGGAWPGMDLLAELCPDLPGALPSLPDYQERYPRGAPSEALLTLSLTPYSPVPALSALLRLDSGLAPLYAELQDALIACVQGDGLAEVTPLEQDGVTLYVVGDAGDFPIVVGHLEDMFFLGTNPETLRGVVRRMGGASESSLADSRLHQRARDTFSDSRNHLSFSLDFGMLAETLQNFGGMLAQDEGGRYLLTRSTAMFRTLGGVAAQLSATPDGLLQETLLATDPDGGDEALLELLNCEGCTVSNPRLAPETAVAASAHYLPWRELWRYLQDWLTGYEAATGERLGPGEVLSEMLGVDFDAAMFDWLGSELHVFTLGSVSPDLRTLIYNPAQVMVIPVSSPQSAEAGLAAWGALFETLGGLGMSTGRDMGDAVTNALLQADVRETSYAGVALKRVRFGPNLDVAYGFLGNYLVLGTPASALYGTIDTFQGARGLSATRIFQDLRRGLPERLSSLSYSDQRAQLLGLRDLTAALSQPFAFIAEAGLQGWLEDLRSGDVRDGGWDEEWDEEWDDWEDSPDESASYDIDLTGIVTEPFETSGEVTGTLDADMGVTDTYFELTGVQPGDEVEVRVSSDAFDTYMTLIDAEASLVLMENDDDEVSTNSVLRFTVTPGARYWVHATSYWGDGIGEYTLSVTVTPASTSMPMTDSPADDEDGTEMDALQQLPSAEDLPSFGELLGIFDLLPQALEVLAEHISTSEGYTHSGEDGVYSRQLLRVRW